MRRVLICFLLVLQLLTVSVFSRATVAAASINNAEIASNTLNSDEIASAPVNPDTDESLSDTVNDDDGTGQQTVDEAETASPAVSVPVVATVTVNAPTVLVPTVSLPEPVQGDGDLAVTIESFAGGNPKRISQLAERVELWLGDKRLASLNSDEPEVVQENKRRLFIFPKITLPHGYYFITVRCYGSAALYGRRKWHGETFQVGIHPGKHSRVFKKITFFHW